MKVQTTKWWMLQGNRVILIHLSLHQVLDLSVHKFVLVVPPAFVWHSCHQCDLEWFQVTQDLIVKWHLISQWDSSSLFSSEYFENFKEKVSRGWVLLASPQSLTSPALANIPLLTDPTTSADISSLEPNHHAIISICLWQVTLLFHFSKMF